MVWTALIKWVLACSLAVMTVVQARVLSPNKDISVASVQTDVEFFDQILQLKRGENKFAWGLFNDGEDEIDVMRLRVIVSSDGVRYDSEIQEYKNLKVKPSEEISVPWKVSLESRSYPRSGSIQAVLEMRDEDGKSYENVVLDRKCRFPGADDYGIVTGLMAIGGSVVLIVFIFFVVITGMYGTDGVASFIDSKFDFRVLWRTKKHAS